MADGNSFNPRPSTVRDHVAAAAASAERATYSTFSANPWVNGGDWPAWQRDLYPATYLRTAEEVMPKLKAAQANLAAERRYLARALKAGDRRAAEAYRKSADRYAGHVRNCLTQLRLIEGVA